MVVVYRTPVGASTSLASDDAALQALRDNGWDADCIRNTNEKPVFGVLHRVQYWGNQDCQPSKSASALTGAQNITPVQGKGSNPALGGQKGASTPAANGAVVPQAGGAIAPLDVTTLPTLARIRRKGTRLVFAVDTEFYYPHGTKSHERELLTWQVAFCEPDDEDTVHSLVFFSLDGRRIDLDSVVAYCLERFDLVASLRSFDATACPDNGFRKSKARRWTVPLYDTKGALWDDRYSSNGKWEAFGKFDDARKACGDPDFTAAYDALASTHKQPSRVALSREAQSMPNGNAKDKKGRGLAGYTYDFTQYHGSKGGIPITILCHAGKADLSAFRFDDDGKDVMRRVSDVQGGLVSMQTFAQDASGVNGNHHRFFPLDVDVRDTMCFAAAGNKSLEGLGKAVGFAKLALKAGYSKDAMDVYLAKEPVAFMEYASRDAEVTLKYAGTLFGFNKDMPVTASSAAVRSIVETIKADWGLKRNEQFDEQWRGICQVSMGLVQNPSTGKLQPVFQEAKPVSAEAEIVQMFARNSYKGGANGCSVVGWIDGLTYDLDLCSAYPTAMSCVFDVDWTSDQLIVREWKREWARLQDFRTPFDPIWAYVDEFEFPPDVKYPCIAVNIDGCITFPRTLGERDGVYVTGVEIYTALRLGARVHIQHGYQASYRVDSSGQPTRSLFLGVSEFVRDRTTIKQAIKNGQKDLVVFEQLEKTMVNSTYGKTAQNVVEKNTWNALTQEMEDLGMSRITSPTHSSMTTAIVRCVLMAAMNELEAMGYESYSYTTDGFITTADAVVANGLPLCGMAPFLQRVRISLAGDDTVWEAKHQQDGFYNVTTRGNMSPDVGGVCAHNSYVSPYPSKSLEDRLHCLDVWLRRTLKVDCTVGVWSKFRDMADVMLRDDFFVEDKLRSLSMDFDLKRKPVKTSLKTVRPVINGEEYEVCNVETVPYETPEEYEFYKTRGKSSKCLRTEVEWRSYFARLQSASAGIQRHVKDWEWSRLFTCVMGHRLGVWCIPTLDDASMTVQDKCDWVNQHNGSSKTFEPTHWKNARRQERMMQMLDRSDVDDLLHAMGAIVV